MREKKHFLDKFYTKPEIAAELISHVDITRFKTIVEPSAGAGAFSRQIPNCIALDIFPESDNIQQIDFLTFDGSKLEGPVLVIGNPPFGRQSSDAIRFIRHASTFADTIAFILPASFKKSSLQDRIPLNFFLKKEVEVPLYSFVLEGRDYPLWCVFQIWERQEILRSKTQRIKEIPGIFKIVNKEEPHDFSFRRVGGTAGSVDMDTIDKCVHSHFFVSVDDKSRLKEIFECFKKIAWNFRGVDTAGPRSISATELCQRISGSLV